MNAITQGNPYYKSWSSLYHGITLEPSGKTKQTPKIPLLRIQHKRIPLNNQITEKRKIENFQATLEANPEFKNLIWEKLGDNDKKRYQVLSKIYQEHGFIGPLDLLEKATIKRLEDLNCPKKISQKVHILFDILSSKKHNLSGYLPKAYSRAALESVELYKSIINNSKNSKHPKDVQIFFGDYGNLGNTNKYFAGIIEALLNKSLDLSQHGEEIRMGIQSKSGEEKETLIKSLEEILFHSDVQGKPLIIAKDWDILKKTIRAEAANPLLKKLTTSSLYQDSRHIKNTVSSIAEQAGTRLTDMMGVVMATKVKKVLEKFSKSNIIAFGLGGDEISGIVCNPDIDPVLLANTVNKEIGELVFEQGLTGYPHGKYTTATLSGLGLGFVMDSSENLKKLGQQLNDPNPCSVLERAYLTPSKEAARIVSGCIVPFEIERLLYPYTTPVLGENGLAGENSFQYSANSAIIKDLRRKLQTLKDLYTRNDEFPELTGRRYTQHTEGKLTIDDFIEDLCTVLELQKEAITDEEFYLKNDVHDCDITNSLAQKLLIRARLALIQSENYERTNETKALIKEKQTNKLSVETIANYLLALQNIYKSSSPIPEANNLFPPLEITSRLDPNKKLLFTSKVDRDLAALEAWLETDFQTTKNKSEIQAIISSLIKLQEEQDPITQTLSGSNLQERIKLYGEEDIPTMNKLYPQKQSINQSKYPNEPLALALNVLNLAAFNKHLSVTHADKFLEIISKELTSIIKAEGFPNAEKLVFHRGGAKFIVLLPPYLASTDKKEILYTSAELIKKGKKIQKNFFDYIESLNSKTIKEVIPTENQDNTNNGLTIGQLPSPKNHDLKGTALATWVMRFIKTNQHDGASMIASLYDPESTIASLCNSVEGAEERLKREQLKQ
jgi:hypothetical protein